jgi:hypothetical protein
VLSKPRHPEKEWKEDIEAKHLDATGTISTQKQMHVKHANNKVRLPKVGFEALRQPVDFTSPMPLKLAAS